MYQVTEVSILENSLLVCLSFLSDTQTSVKSIVTEKLVMAFEKYFDGKSPFISTQCNSTARLSHYHSNNIL